MSSEWFKLTNRERKRYRVEAQVARAREEAERRQVMEEARRLQGMQLRGEDEVAKAWEESER